MDLRPIVSPEAMRQLQEAARDGWPTPEEMEAMADTECLGCSEGFKRLKDGDQLCPACATKYTIEEVGYIVLADEK